MAQLIVCVKSTEGWIATGLKLAASDRFSITAEGTWLASPGSGTVNANGNSAYSTQGRNNYAYSSADGREGQLIARVGTAAAFVCGGTYQGTGHDGELCFVINDDLTATSGQGLADNDGMLKVTITIGS